MDPARIVADHLIYYGIELRPQEENIVLQ